MKKYLSLIIGILSLAFIACDTDIDTTKISKPNFSGNVAVDTNVPFVCGADNAKDTAFIFTWLKADFGEQIPCSYTIQFDLVGSDFASPYEMVVGNSILIKHLTSGELNSAMHGLGLPIDVASDLDVRILSKPMVIGASKPVLPTVVSDTKVSIKATSFARAALHMVGTMFGSHPVFGDPTADPYAWDNTNYRHVMFRDNPLGLDVYTAQFRGSEDPLYMGAFKLIQNKDLGGGAMLGKVSDGVLGSGGDIKDITKAGYYTVTVDIIKMTYAIEAYNSDITKTYSSVKLTGAGVSTTIAMQQAVFNPHIWVADDVQLTANEVQFELDGSTTWGGTTFPWGKGDKVDASVDVSIAGNYFVKFSDLTGHYVFYKK